MLYWIFGTSYQNHNSIIFDFELCKKHFDKQIDMTPLNDGNEKILKRLPVTIWNKEKNHIGWDVNNKDLIRQMLTYHYEKINKVSKSEAISLFFDENERICDEKKPQIMVYHKHIINIIKHIINIVKQIINFHFTPKTHINFFVFSKICVSFNA